MDKIYFSKTKPNAIIPSKELENAGYDFYPCFEEDNFVFQPHETRLVPTGIAWASSPKYYLQIEERGSTGSKGIKRSAGVVDSGYRGEIFIAITNANAQNLVISKLEPQDFFAKNKKFSAKNTILYPYKKAIAQGVLVEVPKVKIEEISYEELQKIASKRGTGALGSSNK